MKIKFLITVIAFASFAISCKDEKKPTEAAVPEKQNFVVEMDVVSEFKDDFAVYFTESGTNEFIPDQAIWSGVDGGSVNDKLVFDMPEDVIPTNIRIDFGIKTGQERGDVTLEKLKLSFNGKNFETKGSDFLKYFIKNDSIQTEVDDVKGTITFKKNPKSKLQRFYYPQQSVLDEIQKITN